MTGLAGAVAAHGAGAAAPNQDSNSGLAARAAGAAGAAAVDSDLDMRDVVTSLADNTDFNEAMRLCDYRPEYRLRHSENHPMWVVNNDVLPLLKTAQKLDHAEAYFYDATIRLALGLLSNLYTGAVTDSTITLKCADVPTYLMRLLSCVNCKEITFTEIDESILCDFRKALNLGLPENMKRSIFSFMREAIGEGRVKGQSSFSDENIRAAFQYHWKTMQTPIDFDSLFEDDDKVVQFIKNLIQYDIHVLGLDATMVTLAEILKRNKRFFSTILEHLDSHKLPKLLEHIIGLPELATQLRIKIIDDKNISALERLDVAFYHEVDLRENAYDRLCQRESVENVEKLCKTESGFAKYKVTFDGHQVHFLILLRNLSAAFAIETNEDQVAKFSELEAEFILHISAFKVTYAKLKAASKASASA